MPFPDQMLAASVNYNTGVPTQYILPKEIHKIILIPKGRQFTQAEILVMYATLLAGCKHSTRTSRMYPIGNIINLDDKSSDPQVNSTPYGQPVMGNDGVYHFVFSYTRGGVQYHNKLRNMFHEMQDNYDFLIVDKNTNTIIGTKPVLSSTVYYMQGFALSLLYVLMMKWANGSDASKLQFGLVLADADEITERITTVTVDSSQYNFMNLVGLKDLELQLYSAISGVAGKIRIVTGWGATDLYDPYAAALVTLTANWTFRDASNNSLTCTVSADAATKSLVLTFTNNAAWIAVPSGGLITVNTPTVAQMDATIPGYAEGQITLVKP